MKAELWAYFVWDELINCAKDKTTITYSDLAKRIDFWAISLRHPLECIQKYCQEKEILPLSILVISKNTKLPGDGFTATDTSLFTETLKDIYSYDWDQIENPFTNDLVDEILTSNNTTEIYTKVKSRGIAQSLFRRALLDAYNNKCAISGITIKECLEAAHVIPWTHADDNQKLDVRNGILLSATLHRLFDAGIIKINEDYTVIVDNTDESNADILKYHGQKVRLPRDENHKPSKNNLKRR
ncbi:HNH endonuclease [Francisella philomiragia]|uniref:HNH endonuclease n=1 Tax=Francisella philomiragia TaxID=28110 RepID=UPI001907CDD0|nr:HNH endonuclease [Francisella philomiragia]MBK2105673.1 HNH endonuclease [Francisella philomiragia]